MTPSLQYLQERVLEAVAAKTMLSIQGAHSKAFYGNPANPSAHALDTRGHQGIVSYEPTELVITALCGTPLAQLQATLAQNKQCLAFDPPSFGDHATVGGMVASGLSGPPRASVGAVKDYVLGAQLIDGRGEVLKFGGQVMKNVAGYDVSRLLCGSMGALGLITQVSLKVLPQPKATATVQLQVPQALALQLLNQWAGQPVPLQASCWMGQTLYVCLAGAYSAVEQTLARWLTDYAQYNAVQTPAEPAQALWLSLREQTHSFFEPSDLPLWRLSVSSTASALPLQGTELIEWGGAQRWWRTAMPADQIRALAVAAGGHATRFRAAQPSARNEDASTENINVFTPLSPALALIHQRLKTQFDPHGVFDASRLGI